MTDAVVMLAEFAAQTGHRIDLVTGRARTAEAVRARRAAIKWLAGTGLSVVEVARALALDHTTVSYALGNRRRSR